MYDVAVTHSFPRNVEAQAIRSTDLGTAEEQVAARWRQHYLNQAHNQEITAPSD